MRYPSLDRIGTIICAASPVKRFPLSKKTSELTLIHTIQKYDGQLEPFLSLTISVVDFKGSFSFIWKADITVHTFPKSIPTGHTVLMTGIEDTEELANFISLETILGSLGSYVPFYILPSLLVDCLFPVWYREGLLLSITSEERIKIGSITTIPIHCWLKVCASITRITPAHLHTSPVMGVIPGMNANLKLHIASDPNSNIIANNHSHHPSQSLSSFVCSAINRKHSEYNPHTRCIPTHS